MTDWYSRPVFFVSTMSVTVRFYVESLGFFQEWSHEEEGSTIVCQVARGACELILAIDPAARGRFTSLRFTK